jgi:hypothetical protein
LSSWLCGQLSALRESLLLSSFFYPLFVLLVKVQVIHKSFICLTSLPWLSSSLGKPLKLLSPLWPLAAWIKIKRKFPFCLFWVCSVNI